jgi:hypothetical protein
VCFYFCSYIAQQLAPGLKRDMNEPPDSMDNYVEGIKQDRLRLRTVVLQHVKRDTPVLIKGDDLAVKESVWREVLACFGDRRELISEAIRP